MEINTNAQLLNELPSPWIMDTFINPLKEFGLIPLSYTHIINADFTTGLHFITMQIPNGLILTPEQRKEIRDICTQDDDNQPPATHTHYFGTLMIYIPYFG